MYRLGVVLALGLFLNALVGLLNLMRGTPAFATAPQPVYLTDSSGVKVATHKPTGFPSRLGVVLGVFNVNK
jgi:hypothetical protein